MNPNQTHLAKILFWFFLSLILAGLAVVAEGQETASTKHFPRIDWKQATKSGLLEDSIARGVDVYSTHLALSRGAHEMFLPAAIANHPAALASYQLATIETEHLLSHQLAKRHHPNLARSIDPMDRRSPRRLLGHPQLLATRNTSRKILWPSSPLKRYKLNNEKARKPYVLVP